MSITSFPPIPFIPLGMQTKRIAARLAFLLFAFSLTVLILYLLFFYPGPWSWFDLRTVPVVLKVAITGLPIAFVLWLFRTSDTAENLHNNVFVKGVDCIHADDTLSAGLTLLMSISIETRVFDRRIKNMFIQLLMKCQLHRDESIKASKPLITYAQHIIVWSHMKRCLPDILKVLGEPFVRLDGQVIYLDDPHIYKAFEEMQDVTDKKGVPAFVFFQDMVVIHEGEKRSGNIQEFFDAQKQKSNA